MERDAVAGEEGGGLARERPGDDAALEAGCLCGGGQSPAGGGAGDLLAGRGAVPEPGGGVGCRQGGLDVEDAVIPWRLREP
ncbi:hypothetical protein [Streptomyces sp. SD15]